LLVDLFGRGGGLQAGCGNGCFDHGSPGIPDLKAPFSVGVGGFGGPGVLGVSFPAGTAGTNGLIT